MSGEQMSAEQLTYEQVAWGWVSVGRATDVLLVSGEHLSGEQMTGEPTSRLSIPPYGPKTQWKKNWWTSNMFLLIEIFTKISHSAVRYMYVHWYKTTNQNNLSLFVVCVETSRCSISLRYLLDLDLCSCTINSTFQLNLFFWNHPAGNTEVQFFLSQIKSNTPLDFLG